MKFIEYFKWKIRKFHYQYLYPNDRVFIHIPKTGGISYYKTRYNFSLGHFSIYQFQNITNLSHKKYIAIVRDPVERFISSVNHMKNNGSSNGKFNDAILRKKLFNLNLYKILDYFEYNFADLNNFDPIFKEQSFYLNNKSYVQSLLLCNFKNFHFKKKKNTAINYHNYLITDEIKERIYKIYHNDYLLYKKLEDKNSIEISLN